jgi:hypothetical protein
MINFYASALIDFCAEGSGITTVGAGSGVTKIKPILESWWANSTATLWTPN